MIVTDFVTNTYLLATGKSGGLEATNPKYAKILALGNIFQQSWMSEPGIEWDSCWVKTPLVPLVTATDTFAIPTTVLKLSDKEDDPVVIVHTDGNESEYKIVSPNQLHKYRYSNACAKIGGSLVFSSAFEATDPQIGGTIYVPSYTEPTALVNPTDVIAVDRPMWLCYMSAAEYDRNEVDKQNQYANLIALATNEMEAMKQADGGQLREIPMYETAVGDLT